MFFTQSDPYRVGEWVEVRSKVEVLATLDKNGRLEGMPFMPEMFAFCGQRFQVFKSAHKTCDTVYPVRGRRVDNAVHLRTRCNGSAHGGCQAGCLLFWKKAWLRPAAPPDFGRDACSEVRVGSNDGAAVGGGCSEEDIERATLRTSADKSDPTYVCQATLLPDMTHDLSPFDPRQYLRDLRSGNVTFFTWMAGLTYITYQKLINLGIGWGPLLRRLYDVVKGIVGGVPYPRHMGLIPLGQPTPTAQLDLTEGEWVRVKSQREILATCNVENRNRGMFFDAEQVPYCGGIYRVQKRVSRIINENTGKMMRMKSPCVVLEDVFCKGRYSECRMFCPRAIYAFWHEIWLERVPEPKRLVR